MIYITQEEFTQKLETGEYEITWSISDRTYEVMDHGLGKRITVSVESEVK